MLSSLCPEPLSQHQLFLPSSQGLLVDKTTSPLVCLFLSLKFVVVFNCMVALDTPVPGVKLELITDLTQIYSPSTPEEGLKWVEDSPLPSPSEVKDVFNEMVHGSGVSYRHLMSVIGACTICHQVMALSHISTHPCIGCTKEPGPCPSKYPHCYNWLSSQIREAYEEEQGRRRALVQQEWSKARQSGWRQDVLSE